MPTKTELEQMLAEANAKIEALETDGGGALETGGLYYMSSDGLVEVTDASVEGGVAASVDANGGLHIVPVPTAADRMPVCDRIIAMVGVDDWNVACAHVANESDNNVNVEANEARGHCVLTGLTENEMTDAVLHVLLRPVMDKTTEEFAEAIGNQSVRITTLQDENRRLRVELDDARHKLGTERQAKAEMHGSIDSLKPVT